MRDSPTRITVHLDEPDRDVIRRAAQRSGLSLEAFVRDAALRVARADDAAARRLLHPDDWTEIFSALYRPGRPSGGLAQLLSRESVLGQRAQLPVEEILRLLSGGLGQELLAITVDVGTATLDSWIRGDTSPEPAAERRLRNAHEVWQFVMSVESAETTRAWMMGRKEQLGDISPAEAIAAGEERAVMSIARDFVEGG